MRNPTTKLFDNNYQIKTTANNELSAIIKRHSTTYNGTI